MGQEFRALSELVGGRSKALALYQLFRDPPLCFWRHLARVFLHDYWPGIASFLRRHFPFLQRLQHSRGISGSKWVGV